MRNKLTFLITVFLICGKAYTQEAPPPVQNPPVVVETTFNNRGVFSQAIVNKKFRSVPKLGMFAITEVLGNWHRSKPDEYMVQGNLTYEFAKGFNLHAGFHMASGIGVRPALGVMYSYGKPDLLVVVNPRYYIDDIGNLEALALVEYKPRINEEWSFYSKIQGLYTFTADGGIHGRSYIMLRAGVTYKEFSFGPAATFDYYGPNKINENSFGAFFTVALF